MIRWLVFLLWVCAAAQAQEAKPPAAAEQAALAVEVAQASRAPHERSLAADGVVVARELAAVNAQVAGVSLAKLNADVGDRVQAGQVLAVFDTALLKQEVAQAQAQEARAQAALAQAKRNAARAGKLVQERARRRQRWMARWRRASWRSCASVMRRCAHRSPGWWSAVRRRSG